MRARAAGEAVSAVGAARRRPAGVSYRKAGVDIAGADAWLHGMRRLIATTRRPEVLADRGQFAGLFRLRPGRWRDPVLVASADGVGTKLEVAKLAGDHSGIGIDLVAMNTNDLLAYGAEPLFFLDYIAVGRLQPAVMSEILKGVVEGCRQSGCALLGGETAEMPGVYADGDYDVAGFAVGVADRARLIDGRAVRAGDAIIGLASTGVHANGFSLVRRVFGRAELRRLRHVLLRPTRIYVKPVLGLLRRVPVHAIAHVTGGGLRRRVPALIGSRPGLSAEVEPGRWPRPEIFGRLAAAGVSEQEMNSTFNMGLGLVLACPAGAVSTALRILRQAGCPAWHVGVIRASASRVRRSQ